MNKHAYLGRSILDISKIAICDYLYHYIKRKYEVNTEIRSMETDNFLFPNYVYSSYRGFYNNTNTILVINKKQSPQKCRTFTDCPIKIYIKNKNKKIK